MKKVFIVLGLGYGDEGKGMVTANIVAHNDQPLVIRFNGGHQAGHTVVKDGVRHVFSSFGSGSLHGAPTYWSPFCTVYPTGLLKEYDLLLDKGQPPILFIDPLCPITTPWDVNYDQSFINRKGHTVGVGYGQTIKRTNEHYTLFAKDLFYPTVLAKKLDAIADYYPHQPSSDLRARFLSDCQQMLECPTIYVRHKDEFMGKYSTWVFEGAQGILLDQLHGFFPYVTRSNTTSKNALEIIRSTSHKPVIEMFLVTRAYQTRHGNGPLTWEETMMLTTEAFNNETNQTNPYQGRLRYGHFDASMVDYAIDTEIAVNGKFDRKIIMTCCDQVSSRPWYTSEYYPIYHNYSPEHLTYYETEKTLS